jgi:peptide/nickel transport system ATP-binding protein
MPPILEIEKLSLALPPGADRPYAIEGVSLSIERGETLCVVGESGSGKSMTALAAIGLLPSNVRPVSGSIRLDGRELVGLPDRDMRAVRGRDIGMIFQEPMTSLNPVLRIGDQIAEVFEAHDVHDAPGRSRRTLELLGEVGLPDPQAMAARYPHQLSGGQRQRVVIAMALALEPKLIVADEPTTALDVTTQAQILKLLDALRRLHGTAVLFITHDFGVVAEVADRVAVLQHGRLVEAGRAGDVLAAPTHDYTRKLLAAVPSLKPPAPRKFAPGSTAITVAGLSKTYRSRHLLSEGENVTAAEAVSFEIRRGETLGLVGESGSGKSTVGRCLVRLTEPDGGSVRIGGMSVDGLSQSRFRPVRRRIQMVFQDPFASLDPRRTIGRTIADGPIAQGTPKREALSDAGDMLELVGLRREVADRYPHEFSGGQRQRIGIARALASRPEILVADEPVSALDVSIQAKILALLQELQEQLGLAILFVTHDLRVAAQISDRIAVMHQGRVVELKATGDLLRSPEHAYTRALLSAVPGGWA